MFSGIIQGIGEVIALQKNDNGAKISLDIRHCQPNLSLQLGDSVAVNGVCLTVISYTANDFEAEISNTSLNLTNLQHIKVGSKLNLEPALTLKQAVNGHLVTGHVDAECCLNEVTESGFSRILSFSVPKGLSKYIVERGSVTLDGVSLTVNSVLADTFTVTIVPHTWQRTIAHQWQVGSKVNLEVDMIARYLERLQQAKHGQNI